MKEITNYDEYMEKQRELWDRMINNKTKNAPIATKHSLSTPYLFSQEEAEYFALQFVMFCIEKLSK